MNIQKFDDVCDDDDVTGVTKSNEKGHEVVFTYIFIFTVVYEYIFNYSHTQICVYCFQIELSCFVFRAFSLKNVRNVLYCNIVRALGENRLYETKQKMDQRPTTYQYGR